MAAVPDKLKHRTVLIYESVTGGGLAGCDMPASWAAEGSAMRRALARDFAALPGVSVVMTLDDRLPPESSPATTLRVTSAGEPIAHARHADHTVIVAPETGGTLANLAEIIANTLGCTPEAIALAGDKLRFADHLISLGIPTPPTLKLQPDRGLPPNASYPAVLKPIDGAGSADTWFISGSNNPNSSNYSSGDAILQPFIAGEPRSASFLVDRAGEPHLLGVCRQEMEREDGRFFYGGGTLLPEGLPVDHPAICAVRSIKGLRGWVGVDYIQDEATGTATVLELNPRATTSCVAILSVLEPGRVAAAWLDEPQPGEPWPIALPRVPVAFRADGSILSPPESDG